LSLTVFDALSPAAYAAQEPAQDDHDGILMLTVRDEDREENEQSDEALFFDFTVEAEPSFDESKLIELKVTEAVKRALAQVEKLKQEKHDKAARKVEEKLAVVKRRHIELEKEARAKALAARKKATLELQAAEEGKPVKERLLNQVDEDGAIRLPPDDAGKLAKARNRLLLSDGEESNVLLQHANDERIDQLTAMVKKLSVQVERLSKELEDLREGEKQRNKGGDDEPPSDSGKSATSF
jgi:hypothetical protein